MKMDKVLSLIGLAQRARKLVSGEYMTEAAVKDGTAELVIIASDVSENTRKKFTDKCSYYGVPVMEYSDKETLGHAMGKEFRASLAVTDKGFAQAILEKMN